MAKPRDEGEEGNTRKCVATGALLAREALVRFTLDPQGRLTADLSERLPGRGVWTLASRAAIVAAAEKGLFARALKAPAPFADATSPAALAASVEDGIEKRLLAAMGLARRAGGLRAGFEKVREALKDGQAALVFIAADAGADGARKISRQARDLPVLRALGQAAQSAAIGVEGAIYAAALKGPQAERILREARRLSGFRKVFDEAGAPDRGGEGESELRA